MQQNTIGLIGVGLVGTALAERLLAAGCNVIGFDLNQDSLRNLQAVGGQPATNASAVFATASTIFLSLPTSAIASQLLAEVSDLIPQKTIIDTTTGEPAETQEIGQSLAARGARYLDATIAGSSAQVRSAEAIVMVGGDANTVADCRHLLDTFSARVFHVGSWGAGARTKLVVNLVLGLHRAVLAEALCFAERTGVDPQLALEILRAGPAYSRVMDTKAKKMLDGDFEPQARLSQHLKDVRLILASGSVHQAQLPLSSLHLQLLEHLDREGFGALDNSAIIKAFQQQA